jgi:hypothetical protein
MTTTKENWKEPRHVALVNDLRMIVLRLEEAEELVKDLRATRNDIAVTLVRDVNRSISSIAREAHMTRALLSERVQVAAAMEAIYNRRNQDAQGPTSGAGTPAAEK